MTFSADGAGQVTFQTGNSCPATFEIIPVTFGAAFDTDLCDDGSMKVPGVGIDPCVGMSIGKTVWNSVTAAREQDECHNRKEQQGYAANCQICVCTCSSHFAHC